MTNVILKDSIQLEKLAIAAHEAGLEPGFFLDLHERDINAAGRIDADLRGRLAAIVAGGAVEGGAWILGVEGDSPMIRGVQG